MFVARFTFKQAATEGNRVATSQLMKKNDFT